MNILVYLILACNQKILGSIVELLSELSVQSRGAYGFVFLCIKLEYGDSQKLRSHNVITSRLEYFSRMNGSVTIMSKLQQKRSPIT